MGCCFSNAAEPHDGAKEAPPQESLRTARSSLESDPGKHALPVAPQRESMSDVFLSCCAEADDTHGQVIRSSASWDAFARLLDVDVEDPAILVVASDIARAAPDADIQTMAIEMAPFLSYCQQHHILNTAALRTRVRAQRDVLADCKAQPFRQVYTFVFSFIKLPSVRNVGTDECVMYWQLLLPTWPYLDPWLRFVAGRQPAKEVVTRDEWLGILDLVCDGQEAFDTYNAASSSWPLLIDEFIEQHLAAAKKAE